MSFPDRPYRWVAPGHLAGLLEQERVRVLDVRECGKSPAEAPHVPGAIHASALELLTTSHCLPVLAFTLAKLGVGDEHAIVVYDEDGSGPALDVARLLVERGHAATWALAGGFRAWRASGLSAVRRWSTYPPASFTARFLSEANKAEPKRKAS
jgi:3-mercaptopyruvate sulfurtransferase SseA